MNFLELARPKLWTARLDGFGPDAEPSTGYF